MAFTEFCCRSGGSNLNAGTRTGDSTEPGTAADLTYASGTWVSATRVFTVASGDPVADGLAVDDYVALDTGAATATMIGRVTARTTTTITISSTFAGANPANGTYTLRVGGAWKGFNAAEYFPGEILTNLGTNLKNAAGDELRINFKNAAVFSISATIATALHGPCYWQGYTTSYGDGGKAIIDGGSPVGSSFVLLSPTVQGAVNHTYRDLVFRNNGDTGTSDGVSLATTFIGCVTHGIRGDGFVSSRLIECEAFDCNKANTSGDAGMKSSASGASFTRCISHHNTGSNNRGFYNVFSGCLISHCIAWANGEAGIHWAQSSAGPILNCDCYANGGNGITQNVGNSNIYIENCNLLDNGAYGIAMGASDTGVILNCGFGGGTKANTSGALQNGGSVSEEGTVSYASDVTPWNNPDDGDFDITLAAAQDAGRAGFPGYDATYGWGTTGYADIGAAGHVAAAGGGPVAQSRIIQNIGTY
jgi:hypothetical protein